MVLWGVAVLALAAALVGLARARSLGRRLDALNQTYWELRYDYTRLRSQVARLDPEQSREEQTGAVSPSPTVAFVPLSSIRKKEQ